MNYFGRFVILLFGYSIYGLQIKFVKKPDNLIIKNNIYAQNLDQFLLTLYGLDDAECCHKTIYYNSLKYPKTIMINIYHTTLNSPSGIWVDQKESTIVDSLLNVNDRLDQLKKHNNLSASEFKLTYKTDPSEPFDAQSSPNAIIIDIYSDEDVNNKIKRQVEYEYEYAPVNDDRIHQEQLSRIMSTLTKPTPGNYATVFNIIFWLSFILILAVYAIAVALWHMNPGDTIIYRVTNTRYKKDL